MKQAKFVKDVQGAPAAVAEEAAFKFMPSWPEMYDLVKELGGGAFGQTHLAKRKSDGQHVVLKRFKPTAESRDYITWGEYVRANEPGSYNQGIRHMIQTG